VEDRLGRVARFSKSIHEQKKLLFLGVFGLKPGLDQVYENAIGGDITPPYTILHHSGAYL
jgi:hypothetical protein